MGEILFSHTFQNVQYRKTREQSTPKKSALFLNVQQRIAVIPY